MRFLLLLFASACIGVRAPIPTIHTPPVRLTFAVQFYGVPLGGADEIVFVLDRSDSMRGHKFDDAKRELLAAIDGMPDGTRIGIVFFDDFIDTWTMANVGWREDVERKNHRSWLANTFRPLPKTVDTGLVGLSPFRRKLAHDYVDWIDTGTVTAAVPALEAAAALGARHIVFLSDGLANTRGDGTELVALAEGLAKRGVRIDTVGLGTDQDYKVLQQMADATHGVARVVGASP